MQKSDSTKTYALASWRDATVYGRPALTFRRELSPISRPLKCEALWQVSCPGHETIDWPQIDTESEN
jgi:hypothetical protein